jgi:hypothetical protein
VCRVVVVKRENAFKGLAEGLIYMAGWCKQTPVKLLPLGYSCRYLGTYVGNCTVRCRYCLPLVPYHTSPDVKEWSALCLVPACPISPKQLVVISN